MKNNFTNKIAIGTVQFGVSYGVSNDGGQTSKHEVNKILQYAHDVGINTLDTASNYGCSEAVIGDFIQNNNNLLDFDIVTKIPNFPGDSINDYNICELIENFKLSCEKLGKIFIYGLHIHNCENLFLPGGDKLLREIEQLKIDGFIKKIGISVYNSDQIDRILDNFSIDLIQIPINILDQRLVNSGHLSKLKHNDIEIHARSVFLQGLLLMPIENIDPWFDPIKKVLYRFNIEDRKRNLSALQLAFGFVQNIPEVDKIIVGVNTLKQLKEIVNIESTYFDPSEFSCLSVDNLKFINPSNWNP